MVYLILLYFQAKVRLYLPHNFDERKKYPLLINVYGGPNSQQINDRQVIKFSACIQANI